MPEKISAIILAGGLGTRLRSELPDTPKVLAPVNGRPFLDLLLESLASSGVVDKVVLAVGYGAEKVIGRYEDSSMFPRGIAFAVEEELLGTGGGIKNALPQAESKTVLCMNGDSFVDLNLKEFISAHRDKGAALSIALRLVENANRYGLVRMDGSNRIVSFEEKTPGEEKGLINAGVYLFDKKLFDEVEEKRVVSFERELLPDFLKKPVYGFVTSGRFIDIGVPETYRESHEYLKDV